VQVTALHVLERWHTAHAGQQLTTWANVQATGLTGACAEAAPPKPKA
jgi:hypothetical protein